MKYADIVGRFTEACTACELKGQVVRDGNWHPVEHVLRHFSKDGSATFGLVAEQGGTAIVKVTPAKVDPKDLPPGKSAITRPAFLLILK